MSNIEGCRRQDACTERRIALLIEDSRGVPDFSTELRSAGRTTWFGNRMIRFEVHAVRRIVVPDQSKSQRAKLSTSLRHDGSGMDCETEGRANIERVSSAGGQPVTIVV